MLRVLVPGVLALGLATTAAQTQSTPLDEATGQPVAWHLSHDGALAKLAYGASNSDDLALMVTCSAGETDVAIYGDVMPIGVTSQTGSRPFSPDPLSGGEASEENVALSEVGLGELSRKGRMTVIADERIYQLAATRQERRVVDRFLAYCRTGQA